ncbi:MAG TPA: hypothetical protein VFT31_03815 [Kribbella sp.]|nr:hypothetical protein [Kribbella sp.]
MSAQCPGGTSIRADPRDGFAYLQGAVPARTLVMACFGLNLCVGPVLAVGLVQRTHGEGWGAGSLGLFQACSGIAAAVGAVVACLAVGGAFAALMVWSAARLKGSAT